MFLIEKLSASVPHASASGWRVWHHPAAKFGQPPSPPTRSRVIYTVWRALAYGGWIATGDRLFLFFFLFSLLLAKLHNYPLCLLFFNFISYFLNFLFHPYSFYRNCFIFNFILQLQFLICFVFHFNPHYFSKT